MSRSNDIIRVIKGVNLIIDQVILLNKPNIQYKANQIKNNATELIKSILEYNNDLNESKNKDNYKQTTSNYDKNTTHTVQDVILKDNSVNNDINNINLNEFTAIIENQLKETKEEIKSSTVEPNIINKANSLDDHTLPSKSDDLIGFPNEQIANNESDNIPIDENTEIKKVMKARPVPSTQLERMWGFGSLAARMAFGVATESAARVLNLSDDNSNSTRRSLSDENAERLAEALCRMRGAALKLGQMLSIQDDGVLPPALSKALERVRQSADYMPKNQLEQQLELHLGENWRSKFLEFEDIPIAAASIGQVHRAKLLDDTIVAVKIQYPGVADSIESDLQNLKRLVNLTNLLPPGLYIDEIIKVATEELAQECNYLSEAQSQIKYREFVLSDPIVRKHVTVPEVYLDYSTNRILTTKLVPGISIEKAVMYSQQTRNAIARTILITTIKELFVWRCIQSDPNFSNFLYDHNNKMINMIDFGATREYSKSFVDLYMKLVWAAANKDVNSLIEVSKQLHFLTGDETIEMINAHVETGLIVGEPFLTTNPTFDFANSKLTRRISQYGDIFMKYRLTPPPSEAYSLHRKLAGAFLLCIKLKANIPCRDILEDIYNSYRFDS